MIKELRGTESTKKSIQKLKKNEKIMGVNAISNAPGAFPTTANHNTKRAVFILISYRGVQFMDPQTQVWVENVRFFFQHFIFFLKNVIF